MLRRSLETAKWNLFSSCGDVGREESPIRTWNMEKVADLDLENGKGC
jgi:hypothetical protein